MKQYVIFSDVYPEGTLVYEKDLINHINDDTFVYEIGKKLGDAIDLVNELEGN